MQGSENITSIEKALKHLRKDENLAKIIKEFPKPVLSVGNDYFKSLTRSIIYQQLSGLAAGSIERKFLALFGKKKLSPKLVLALSDTQFKSAGVSSQKMKYLRDLSEKYLDGTVDPKHFHTMSDEEIRNHLVKVKGIGVWTADMFLIFTLNRLNVLPTGDLGIQKGFKIVYKMKKLPDAKKMLKLSKDWEPFRTVASLYLWKVADKYK